jgi:FkbM family methyltransferase
MRNNSKLTERDLNKIVRTHFRNWAEVLKGYFENAIPSPLVLRNGMTIEHSPEDRVQDLFYDVFIKKSYTRPVFYRPKPEDTVLDLGANIGLFAIYLSSRAPGIRVHCFEPSSDTRKRLVQNIKHNALGSTVTVHPYAVFNDRCRKMLFHGPYTGWNSLMTKAGALAHASAEEVECIPLPAVFDCCRVVFFDCVKVDVEGSELEILESTDSSTLARIGRIVIECHNDLQPTAMKVIRGILRTNGFEVSLEIDPRWKSLGLLRAVKNRTRRDRTRPQFA